jgi:molybdopterin-guanine dinucleotide biosynthesis protein B
MMHVLSVVGGSGAGKTTLIERLIPIFKAQGLRVSAVKKTHHDIEVDHPGKDTWRMKQAGSFEVVLVSDTAMFLQRHFEQNFKMSVHQVLAQMYEGVDWVLVEGYKSSDLLKLEIIRSKEGFQNPLYPFDDFISAVACPSSSKFHFETALPVLPLDNPEAIADWLIQQQDRFIYEMPAA